MKYAVSTKHMANGGPPGAFGPNGYVAGFGNYEPESLEEQRTRLQQRAGKYDSHNPDDDDLGENDWTVTYTDMVTLLMAFFVILTSIAVSQASSNEGSTPKGTPNISGTGPSTPLDGRGFTIAEYGYPANQDPVDSRYDDPEATTPSTTDASPSGEAHTGTAQSGNPTPLQSTPLPQPPQNQQASVQPPQPTLPQSHQSEQDNQLAQQLQQMVQQNDLGAQVEVISGANAVTLRISDKILFASGRANLEATGQQLVQKLSAILTRTNGTISIEGHTDNVPIRSSVYPSNWELSAARAAMVLRQLVSMGLPAGKLRAIAYADTKPVGSNATAPGRAANRRVELVISSSPDAPQPR